MGMDQGWMWGTHLEPTHVQWVGWVFSRHQSHDHSKFTTTIFPKIVLSRCCQMSIKGKLATSLLVLSSHLCTWVQLYVAHHEFDYMSLIFQIWGCHSHVPTPEQQHHSAMLHAKSHIDNCQLTKEPFKKVFVSPFTYLYPTNILFLFFFRLSLFHGNDDAHHPSTPPPHPTGMWGVHLGLLRWHQNHYFNQSLPSGF